MHLERIFATPDGTPADVRWAIWSLVSDLGEGTQKSEVPWFVEHWQDTDNIDAELERIMQLPRNYINSNPPSIRQLLTESYMLGRMIYPTQLLTSRTQDFPQNAAMHLSAFTKVWKPLYNEPNSKDIRLKGKAFGLDTDFFRIYGIGVRPNIYIITGSALKGTPEEVRKPSIDPVIKDQLSSLNFVLSNLRELGLDEDPDRFFISTPISLD